MFFSIVPPTLLIYALFQFGIPRPPLSADQWTCIIVAPASFALGIFFWCTADVEYEFTGDEILCRRASSVRWRLPIDSITDVRVEVLPRSNSTAWHLQAGTVCRSVLVIESLAEYVTRTTKT